MGRDFGALASPGIRGLASYDPGHDIVALRNNAGDQGLLELGGNESAWGPSLLAMAALRSELDTLELYPDPRGGCSSTLWRRPSEWRASSCCSATAPTSC
jgi:histidinol-phosphate aminotransferase